VVSGWANPSADEGYGSTRWMSPELLDTEVLGQATRKKASDLYALGMVVYEVLSGHVPFHLHACHIVPVKVLRGDRPERPQGPGGRWFTNEIWELLERCWKHQPGDRPSVNQAFECLHTASELWTPHSLPAVGL
jgi:serine/threonine protein kinase